MSEFKKEILRKYKKNSWWIYLRRVLACVVVFCTVYSLILPAITTTKALDCGIDEHIHSDGCYATETLEELVLNCDLQSLGIHKHAEACYDANHIPACGYASYVVHEYNEFCYENGRLVCSLAHVKLHEHTSVCYTTVNSLTCELDTADGSHTHGDVCYTVVYELICTEPEIRLHTHGDGCFDKDHKLICSQLEVLEHKHNAACMANKTVEVLSCQLPEHTHTDNCYALVSTIGATVEPSIPATQEPTAISTEPAKGQNSEPKSTETLSNSGTFEGTEVTWKISEINGGYAVTIGGNGEMPQLTNITNPWHDIRHSVIKVVIENGVTAIGGFGDCINLSDVSISDTVTRIDGMAFFQCYSLVSITIPDSVTQMGAAFQSCTALQSVKLSNGLTEIPNSAFLACSNLQSIVIPDSVSVIGSFAFADCKALASVTFPTSLTSIGDHAFQGCESLKEFDLPANTLLQLGNFAVSPATAGAGTYLISEGIFYKIDGDKAYPCNTTDEMDLPDTVFDVQGNSYSVQSADAAEIGGKCGDNLKWKYETVDGVNTLVIYGDGDMYDYLPDSNGEAPWFPLWNDISRIEIESGATSIGECAFQLLNITEISIPDTVTRIEDSAFNYCQKLTSVSIPGSVKKIGHSAFRFCRNVTSLTLSEGVEELGDGCFLGLSSVEEITIPASVRKLGQNAFNQCSKLNDVTFPEGTRMEFGDGVFSQCPLLVDYQNLGAGMYMCRDGILYLLFDDMAIPCTSGSYPTTISDNDGRVYAVNPGSKPMASGMCGDALEWIVYNEGSDCVLKFAGNGAMYNYTVDTAPWVAYRSQITAIEFPKDKNPDDDVQTGMTSIGAYGFYGLSGIQNLQLPATVSAIGSDALNGCSSMKSVTVEDGNASYTAVSGILYSKDKSSIIHAPAKLAGSIVIPGACAESNLAKFLGETRIGITSITVEEGNSLYSAHNGMLYNADGSVLLRCPMGMQNDAVIYSGSNHKITVAANAFDGCSRLSAITLPEGSLVRLESNAFADSTAVPAYQTLGAGTYLLRNSVVYTIFEGEAIPSIHSDDAIIPEFVQDSQGNQYPVRSEKYAQASGDITDALKWIVYKHDTGLVTLEFFGTGSIGNYGEGSAPWIQFAGQIDGIVLPDGITEIGDHALHNFTEIKTVDLPNSLTRIGTGSFAGCTALETVALPDSLEIIGGGAFADCGVLTGITIPASVDALGNNAFANCTKLANVTLMEGLQSIGEGAFAHCSSLAKIQIPDSVTVIGTEAFYHCENLDEVSFSADSRLETIGHRAFGYCNLRSFTIPQNVTAVGNEIFERTETFLHTVVFNAADCKNFSDTAFYKNNSIKTLVIGPDVDLLCECVLASAYGDIEELLFRGENYLTVENNGFYFQERSFQGNYYVDEQGVVYRLTETDAGRIATLVYCPGDIEMYTVPSQIPGQTAGESSYAIAVASFAFSNADSLHTLYLNPECFVSVADFAFANCLSLKKVIAGNTEATTVLEAETLFAMQDSIGKWIFNNTGLSTSGQITDPSQSTLEKETIRFNWNVSVSGDDDLETLTGTMATVDVGVDSRLPDNHDSSNNHVVRLYFMFSSDDAYFEIALRDGENHKVINYRNAQTGTVIPCVLVRTDVANTYYLEIRQEGSFTFNDQFDFRFNNETAGGTATVWGVMLGMDERSLNDNGELIDNSIVLPEDGQYHYVTWGTVPGEVTLQKFSNGTPKLSGNADQEYTVRDLSYQIVATIVSNDGLTDPSVNQSSSNQPALIGSGRGDDFGKLLVLEDVLEMPAGFTWRSGLLDAIFNGSYRIITPEDGNSGLRECYVDVDNRSLKLFSISNASDTTIQLRVDELSNGTQKLVLVLSSETHTSIGELENMSHLITYGDDVILCNLAEEEMAETHKFRNGIAVRKVNSYSAVQNWGPVYAESEAVNLGEGGYSLTMTSRLTGVTTLHLGDRVEYTIHLDNNGFSGVSDLDYLEDVLSQMHYLDPQDMDAMFAADAADGIYNLSVTIQNANLYSPASVCGLGGTTVTDIYGKQHTVSNSNTSAITDYLKYDFVELDQNRKANGSNVTILIGWDESNALRVTVKETGESCTVGQSGLAAALEHIGYMVTGGSLYTVRWDFTDGYVLPGWEQVEFDLPVTVKNTFMLIGWDHLGTYLEAEGAPRNLPLDINHVSSYVCSETDRATDAVLDVTAHDNGRLGSGDIAVRDWWVNITATVNGKAFENNGTASVGDIVTYTGTVSSNLNAGTIDGILPAVHALRGTQYLLIPVEGNEGHSELSKLTPIRIQNTDYYKISQDATYENVFIGGFRASSVSYSSQGNEPVTIIRWYFPETGGRTSIPAMNYQTVLGSDSMNGANKGFGVYFWLNDHQDHRLVSAMNGGLEYLTNDKQIVNTLGWNETGHDPLADICDSDGLTIIEQSDSVTYRLRIHGIVSGASNEQLIIEGSLISDRLPISCDEYRWNKDNVRISYWDGQSAKTINPNDYEITVSTEEEPRQYIKWSDTTQFTFSATDDIYIYVTLQYPTDPDQWIAFCNANAKERVVNTFCVGTLEEISVYHDVAASTKAVLQKGVHDTGIHIDGEYIASKDKNSRTHYIKGHNIRYYFALYNEGPGRLYIKEFQDILPDGVVYQRDQGGIITVYSETSGYANFSSDVELKVAALDIAEDGQRLRFTIKDSDRNTISYSEALNAYYLLPGEAIVVPYICKITEDVDDNASELVNRIAMPYMDISKSGTKLKLSTAVNISGATYYDTTPNDGDASCITGAVAAGMGFRDSKANDWLYSQVTVYPEEGIRPGVDKNVMGTISGNGNDGFEYHSIQQDGRINGGDAIVWSVKFTNYGGAERITNYTIADRIQHPYTFTNGADGIAAFRYSIYRGSNYDNGEKLIKSGILFPVNDLEENVTKPYSNEVFGNYEVTLRKVDGDSLVEIYFPNPEASIPDGGWAELTVVTDSPDNIMNATFYNRGYIIPMQGFENISAGSETVYDNIKAVEDPATVQINNGYITECIKQVWESGDTENSASSVWNKNQIVLEKGTKEVTYSLTVINADMQSDKDDIHRLVVIDNLPELNDHFTFATGVQRHSEYRVMMVKNSMEVYLNGNLLNTGQYDLDFSTNTTFTDADWSGTSTWEACSVEDARSFRVILDHSKGVVVPAGATVEIRFRGLIPEDAQPGQIAWNSFGYRFSLESHFAGNGDTPDGYQEAGSQKVGVAITSVPRLRKELLTISGDPAAAVSDLTFSFLIYTGEALNLSEADTIQKIGQALVEADRQFTVVDVTVPAGESSSDYVSLSDCRRYGLNTSGNGPALVSCDETWEWVDEMMYTVIELPENGTADFITDSFSGGDHTGVTFQYDPGKTESIVVKNRAVSWQIDLWKTDDSGSNPSISNVWFGLYSPEQADQIRTGTFNSEQKELWDALVAELNATTGQLPMTITHPEDNATYYLTGFARTDGDGKILWGGLNQDVYLLKELITPKGYYPNDTVYTVRKPSDDQTSVSFTVVNLSDYEIPETGGIGTGIYSVTGLLLLVAAAWLVMAKRRNAF